MKVIGELLLLLRFTAVFPVKGLAVTESILNTLSLLSWWKLILELLESGFDQEPMLNRFIHVRVFTRFHKCVKLLEHLH